MEKELSRKEVKLSDLFKLHANQIYDYGYETFGYFQAERYDRKITKVLSTLSDYYTMYSECRHLATKSRRYRNIILDAHLIIYRITNVRIEVLDIVHSKSSVSRIRRVRSIRV